MCLLDGEDTVVPGTMRATGDWVNVKDAQLHYLGRRDRMIKRIGKRVNLDSVQQVSSLRNENNAECSLLCDCFNAGIQLYLEMESFNFPVGKINCRAF